VWLAAERRLPVRNPAGRIALHCVYGLLPDVSKKHLIEAWVIGCGRISGLSWNRVVPGHHGHLRTEGQSRNSDLRGQEGYRPDSVPVRPVTP